MKAKFSERMNDDVCRAVLAAGKAGIVNVRAIAEEVRRRNEADNVALQDVEGLVVGYATLFASAMEFDGETRLFPVLKNEFEMKLAS